MTVFRGKRSISQVQHAIGVSTTNSSSACHYPPLPPSWSSSSLWSHECSRICATVQCFLPSPLSTAFSLSVSLSTTTTTSRTPLFFYYYDSYCNAATDTTTTNTTTTTSTTMTTPSVLLLNRISSVLYAPLIKTKFPLSFFP